MAVLRELAGADVAAGRGSARDWLEQALARTADPRERARIAMEVARAYANSFRWVTRWMSSSGPWPSSGTPTGA